MHDILDSKKMQAKAKFASANEQQESTSLRVSMRLKNALKKLGAKDETYEEIIWRLLDKQ